MSNVCATHNKSHAARGHAQVASIRGPECHAASYYCAKCVNGARRNALNSDIIAFWVSQGVARTSCPRNGSCPEFKRVGSCALGTHVRDMVNPSLAGNWYPMAGEGSSERTDRAEFSHIVSAAHGGAYCACGMLPEQGKANASRGNDDMDTLALTPSACALLAAWPAYWKANVARKASLARLV